MACVVDPVQEAMSGTEEFVSLEYPAPNDLVFREFNVSILLTDFNVDRVLLGMRATDKDVREGGHANPILATPVFSATTLKNRHITDAGVASLVLQATEPTATIWTSATSLNPVTHTFDASTYNLDFAVTLALQVLLEAPASKVKVLTLHEEIVSAVTTLTNALRTMGTAWPIHGV